MFINVNDMQLGKVRFHQAFKPGAIEFDKQLRQVDVLDTEGSAELAGDGTDIRIRGHLKVRMEADCDRCLETVIFPLDTDFELLYRLDVASTPHEEIEIAVRETDVGFYEGDGIELADVLREQVLLSLPMQRVCREDCRGICPVCGQNRNTAECDCHPVAADDRWLQLKNLQK